ncbi:TrkA-N domain protein [Anoxybacillus sp. BCO1]|nr:TrkA-N domain protein [Anoxybacillus sp. BCO1]
MSRYLQKQFQKENALSTGELPYTKGGHVILVGWNERVRQLLALMPSNIPCLVIDETLKRWDVPKHVHFIKGNPTHDDVWKKANVFEARTVIITANQHKNETEADLGSIVTLLTVKALHPSVYTVVEILTTPQVDNAKRAGADETIETNKWISFLMANCLSSPNVLNDVEQFKKTLDQTASCARRMDRDVFCVNAHGIKKRRYIAYRCRKQSTCCN